MYDIIRVYQNLRYRTVSESRDDFLYGYDIFHENIMNNLIKNVRENRCVSTYVFEGAGGLKIHECAKLFAAALTCMNMKNAPCGSCRSCRESKTDSNPDINYIVRQKDDNGKLKKSLGIEAIKDAVNDAYITPFSAPRKVYIINEGDLLTDKAQNALLKILEEPPEYVVYIIIVENISILLQTVLSRATVIHFPRLSDTVLAEYIKKTYPKNQYSEDFLLRFCEGLPGVADEILHKNSKFGAMRDDAAAMLPALFSKDVRKAFDIQDFIIKNKTEAKMIFNIWISYIRDMLLLKCGRSADIVNADKTEELQTLCFSMSADTLISAAKLAAESFEMLRRYVSIKSVALRFSLKCE